LKKSNDKNKKRLKKRTLRSKVKKAIDKIPCECDKLEKYQMKIHNLEEKLKLSENQKFLLSLENHQIFQKRSFLHTKPDSKQYFPNLKEIRNKSLKFAPNLQIKQRKNQVQEICKHLSKNEMLEVFIYIYTRICDKMNRLVKIRLILL